jgi:hypothetical protein
MKMVEHQDFQSTKQELSMEQDIVMHNVHMILNSSMVKQMLKAVNYERMMKMQVINDMEYYEHKWIFFKLTNIQKHICHVFVQ